MAGTAEQVTINTIANAITFHIFIALSSTLLVRCDDL
jgi:hypothetical protein